MGTFFSQYFNELNEVLDEAITHGSSPSSSHNETPKPRVLECDPRSPTDGIRRTPIEVLSVSKGHEVIYEGQYPQLSGQETPRTVFGPKQKFSSIDPRSPVLGLGFNRTPIQFLDDSDHEDFEEASDVELETEEDDLDASGTTEEILQVSDVAPVVEEGDHDEVIAQRLVVTLEAEDHDHDASFTPEQIAQVSDVALLGEDDHDPSSTAAENGQVSDVVLVAKSTGICLVQTTCAEENRVEQEISQAINVDCISSVVKNISKVVTPLRHTVKTDRKNGVLNTSVCSLGTPKNMDKAQCFVVDKENSSSVKMQTLHTPEKKAEDGVKTKVRTPLGVVCGNNSPMQMLRDKQSNLVKRSLSSRTTTRFPHFNRVAVDRP